ncbi:hypothetical protein KP509_24G059200 [Ceratopteris richardii]|uniref:Methyltransferase domain-containing protein n=1 Tax=Ceratopteris richardii TaxID=49495 RepID=A0A8T2RXD8_CERRI|nr:hypothetical protein KP509_24G059200 [Ceratopteris richardii]
MELTREHTVELLQKIAVFLRTHRALWSAHVVEFFQDRLWEHVDTEWWNDLRTASIEELLLLPSGRVRDTWCASLKSFISTAQSLALFRQNGNDFQKIFRGFCKPNISNVLKQGMNAKKLHEVEILSGVISRVFAEAHATHVVDVGAGQGYLAQVLAFEYGLPVVALDASSHHADVTSRRSARIEKHYAACSRKANSSLNTKDHLTRKGPQTATFCVMSGCSGKELQHFLSTLATEESSDLGNNATDRKDDNNAFSLAKGSDIIKPNESSGVVKQAQRSYILAGLHACGDLSAAVLKTYTMCEEVKAVVIVGCCYNLLTERLEKDHSPSSCFYGFPLSRGVRSIGLTLGRRACDLACQVYFY